MTEPRPKLEHDATNTCNEPDVVQLSSQPAQLEEFREGGYGWVVIVAVALLNAHTWGLNSAFAIFLAYYLRSNAFEGTSAIGYAFVGGLSISMSFLVSPLATYMAGSKLLGTRKTIFLGGLFITAGFIGASFTTQLWHLLLSQGVAFGIGLGLCFVASYPIPPQWFARRRSLASACAASGSGFGGLTYSLATNALIARIGLPWTFRVLAILCFVVNGVCSFLIKDRNRAVGSVHLALNWGFFKRPSFLLLQAWLVLSLIGYVILVFSIADYGQSVGLSASQASLVGALFNLSQGLGRPLIGLSSDSVGRINISSLCTLACSVLCLLLWVFGARSFEACIVFALLCGAVAGVMWATAGPLAAEVVGLPLIPSALSMSWLVLTIPATFAEVIGLSLRKSGFWAYLDVQLFVGIFYFAAFVSLWILRAWKIQEIGKANMDKDMRESAVRDDAVVPNAASGAQDGGLGAARRRRVPMLKGFWAIQRV